MERSVLVARDVKVMSLLVVGWVYEGDGAEGDVPHSIRGERSKRRCPDRVTGQGTRLSVYVEEVPEGLIVEKEDEEAD